MKTAPDSALSAAEARRLLIYNPGNGEFRWHLRAGNRIHVGDIAGSINGSGYRLISVNGRNYRASRLAVLIMTGDWPRDQVDHIDRDKLNDRWANLRECTNSENGHNRGIFRNNTSGVTGVSWDAKNLKWAAYIKINGKQRRLGSFGLLNDAIAARHAAEVQFPPFSIGGTSS